MQYQFNERLLQTAAAVASPEDDEHGHVGLMLPNDTMQSMARLRQASENLRQLDAALDM